MTSRSGADIAHLPPESPRSGTVLLVAPRGYCAGVDRAVLTVEKALDLYGPPVYVRKEIVHNLHVVRGLEERGAIFVQELTEVPAGALVIFSAHGVSPAVRVDALARGLRTIDATCPLVTKVHSEARRFAGEGYEIVLIGHRGHEEVEGTSGEVPDRITLVEGPDDADTMDLPAGPVAWLSQTTLSVDETAATVERLRQRLPQLIDPPSDDICYATQNRQQAVKLVAPRCDVLVVVGSGNSSNSVRLAEVGLEAGAGAAYRVDDAGEMRPEWFATADVVGLTSGASVPEDLVAGVVSWLAANGFPNVERADAAEERLTFALPPELRRDLKAVEGAEDR